MSKQLKQYLREDLKRRLGEDRDLIVVQLDALDVASANELRSLLRADTASMTVLRNRVARYAFKDLEIEGAYEVVSGMCAVVHGGTEGLMSSSRVLTEWSKKRKGKGLKVLGGFMEGKAISAADVETLATMPSRDQLLAMIASAVVGPVQNIAGQLNEMIAGVARAVDAVREQKEKAA